MKKILLAIVVAFAGIFGLASCDKPTVTPEKTPTQVTPEQKTFTVSFDTDGGSEVAPIEVKEGEKVTLPANPTKEGLTFGAWYKDVDLTEKFDANAAITEDITLYAQWNVTLTFNSNGGSEVAAITKPYSSKATVYELPAAPTKEGVVFAGWYTDEALTTELSSTFFPKKNTTAYAKWLHTDVTTGYVVDGFNLLDKGSYAIANNEDGSVTYTCVDRELNIQKLVGWMYSAYLHPSTGADLVDAEGNLIYTKLVAKVQGTAGEKVIFKVNDNGAFEKNVELTGEVQDVEIDLTGLTPDKAKSALVIMPGVHQDAPASNVKITSLYFTNGAEGDALKTKDVLIADWAYDTQNKLEQYVGTADYSFGLVELKQNVDGYQVVSARVKGTAGVGLLLKLEGAAENAWIETTIPMTGEDQVINWVVPVENLTRGNSNIKLLFCLNPSIWGAANGAYVTFKNVSIQKLVEADDVNKQVAFYFHTNGGSKVDTFYANIGADVEAPTDPTKDGFIFTGWYTDAALTQAYTFGKAPEASVQLYAGWEKAVVAPKSLDMLEDTFVPNACCSANKVEGALVVKKNTGSPYESVESTLKVTDIKGMSVLKVEFKGTAGQKVIFKVGNHWECEKEVLCTGEVQYIEYEFDYSKLPTGNAALVIMPGVEKDGEEPSTDLTITHLEFANYRSKENMLQDKFVPNPCCSANKVDGALVVKKNTGSPYESVESTLKVPAIKGMNTLVVEFKGTAGQKVIFKVGNHWECEKEVLCTGEVQTLEYEFDYSKLPTANAALVIMPGVEKDGEEPSTDLIISKLEFVNYIHVNMLEDTFVPNACCSANKVDGTLVVKKNTGSPYESVESTLKVTNIDGMNTLVVEFKGTAGQKVIFKVGNHWECEKEVLCTGEVQTLEYTFDYSKLPEGNVALVIMPGVEKDGEEPSTDLVITRLEFARK